MSDNNIDLDKCYGEGPLSSLERKYINEYLAEKGYGIAELHTLPEEEAKRLMREACTYASLKVAEVESRAHLRRDVLST